VAVPSGGQPGYYLSYPLSSGSEIHQGALKLNQEPLHFVLEVLPEIESLASVVSQVILGISSGHRGQACLAQ
jgi:hypothetical protein